MTMASPAERLIVRCHVTSAHAEQSIGFPQSPSGLSSRSRERILQLNAIARIVRKKFAPDLIRGGNRVSEKIMLHQQLERRSLRF